MVCRFFFFFFLASFSTIGFFFWYIYSLLFSLRVINLSQILVLDLKMRSLSDQSINNRILSLFERGVHRFRGDLFLWMQYISYEKKRGNKLNVGKIYARYWIVFNTQSKTSSNKSPPPPFLHNFSELNKRGNKLFPKHILTVSHFAFIQSTCLLYYFFVIKGSATSPKECEFVDWSCKLGMEKQ